ncbi:AMP-binding protein, partial [Endozoicomonas sp. SM1973]
MRLSFDLHTAQEDVYFDQIKHPEHGHYNIGGFFLLKGSLNIKQFELAIKKTVEAFDVHQLTFDLMHHKQHFQSNIDSIHVAFLDFKGESNPKEVAIKWMHEQYSTPFELNSESLFEHALIQISEDEFCWFSRYHHLITDGYGLLIFYQTVAKVYSQLQSNISLEWLKTIPHFKDEITLSLEYVNSSQYLKDKAYWLSKFSEKPQSILQKNYLDTTSGGKVVSNFSSGQYSLLSKLCESYQFSFQHLLIAALTIYFNQVNNQSELVFGVPLHNRRNKLQRQLMGMMTGVIPCKIRIADLTVEQLINSIKRQQRYDYRHQRFPISHLNRDLHLHQLGQEQLFDITVNYRPFDVNLPLEGVKSEFTNILSEDGTQPLECILCDYGTQQPMALELMFQLNYFTETEAQQLANRLIFIMSQLPLVIDSPVNQVPLITSQEQKQLVTFSPYYSTSSNSCIHELFEQQVATTPDQVALVFEDQSLTYAQLNSQANQLAHYLIQQGVTPDGLVGICLDRSPAVIIAMLATLKAGGAYVPLDPTYPTSRLAYMVEDSQVEVILSQSPHQAQFVDSAVPVVDVKDPAFQSRLDGLSNENPCPMTLGLQPDHLAYIIYTSGSTGKPKGVMIEHRALVSHIETIKPAYGITSH